MLDHQLSMITEIPCDMTGPLPVEGLGAMRGAAPRPQEPVLGWALGIQLADHQPMPTALGRGQSSVTSPTGSIPPRLLSANL